MMIVVTTNKNSQTFKIRSIIKTVNIINNVNNINNKYNNKCIQRHDDYMSIRLPDNVNNEYYSLFFRVIECTMYFTVIEHDDFILNVMTNLRKKIKI